MKKLITMITMFASLFLAGSVFAAGSKAEVRGDTHQITASGSMWVDYQYGRPGVYYVDWEDFSTYTAGDWTITTTEDGSVSATEALTDAAYGVLRITTDNTTGDLDSLQRTSETFLPSSTKNIFCEMRVASEGTSQVDLAFGLVVTDTTPFSHTDGVVFKKDNGDTNWDFTTTASSSTSTDAAIATLSSATFQKLGFKIKGVSSVEYWVDDAKMGEFETNIPTTEMSPTIYIANQGTTVATYYTDVDYIGCTYER